MNEIAKEMNDYCENCGCVRCECDHRAEGYECQDCGATPTYRELQVGRCRECAEDRREAARESRSNKNASDSD